MSLLLWPILTAVAAATGATVGFLVSGRLLASLLSFLVFIALATLFAILLDHDMLL